MAKRERKRAYPEGIRPVPNRPGVYRVRFEITDPKTGLSKEVQRHFHGTLDEAVLFRARERAEALAGGEARERQTLRTFARSWIESKKIRGTSSRTLHYHAANLQLHVVPILGDHFMDQLSARDVDRWLMQAAEKKGPRRNAKGEAQPYSPTTVNAWLGTLQQLIRDWAQQEDKPIPAAARVEPLKAQPKPIDGPANALDEADLRRVLAHIKDHQPQWYAYFFVGCMTGMRTGELAGLDWSDIDETAGVIRITKNWRNKRWGMGPTKSGKARSAPLHPLMAEVLRDHRRRLIEQQNPGLAKGIVFPGPRNGERMSAMSPVHAVATAAAACGISYLTPKCMRRTFNDLMRMAGVENLVLRSIVGHTSDAMTAVYSTVRRREQSAAVARVVSMVSGAQPDTKPDTDGAVRDES